MTTTANPQPPAPAPAAPCVHHWQQTERRATVTLFRCLHCGGNTQRPTDPLMREGAPGYRKGKTLDGLTWV